jgi:hypothetical protein
MVPLLVAGKLKTVHPEQSWQQTPARIQKMVNRKTPTPEEERKPKGKYLG